MIEMRQVFGRYKKMLENKLLDLELALLSQGTEDERLKLAQFYSEAERLRKDLLVKQRDLDQADEQYHLLKMELDDKRRLQKKLSHKLLRKKSMSGLANSSMADNLLKVTMGTAESVTKMASRVFGPPSVPRHPSFVPQLDAAPDEPVQKIDLVRQSVSLRREASAAWESQKDDEEVDEIPEDVVAKVVEESKSLEVGKKKKSGKGSPGKLKGAGSGGISRPGSVEFG